MGGVGISTTSTGGGIEQLCEQSGALLLSSWYSWRCSGRQEQGPIRGRRRLLSRQMCRTARGSTQKRQEGSQRPTLWAITCAEATPRVFPQDRSATSRTLRLRGI